MLCAYRHSWWSRLAGLRRIHRRRPLDQHFLLRVCEEPRQKGPLALALPGPVEDARDDPFTSRYKRGNRYRKGNRMALVSRRGLIALSMGLGVVIASVSYATAQAAAPTSASLAVPSTQNVIVMLRDQHTDLPITKGKLSPRVQANRKDQSRPDLERQVARRPQRPRLRLDQRVRRDRDAGRAQADRRRPRGRARSSRTCTIRRPAPAEHGSATGQPATVAHSGICPTDPAKPLLEPEALQVTNTAFLDPATPQAQNLVDGTGVKVAFIADGIDINNPDFIRADGTHVFVDYQDFSGDGPNAPSDAAEAFGDASRHRGAGPPRLRPGRLRQPGAPAAPLAATSRSAAWPRARAWSA